MGIPLKEDIIKFWLPFGLPWIPILIWLRPKIKLLRLKNDNAHFLYQFLACAVIIVPTIIAQEYLVTTTGKLTELNTITEINHSAPTKYYTLKSHFIVKEIHGVHSTFEITGKNNDNFVMHIYFATPIFEDVKKLSNTEPLACLGIKYRKTISNRLEQNEKEAEYQIFANESKKDFDSKNISEFIYLDRISHSDDRDEYIEAIKKIPLYKPSETILIGINEPFEARCGKKLEWIFGSLFIGLFVWLIALLIPKIDEEQLERVKAGKPDKTAQKAMQEFIDFLKPKDGYFITPIFIYINIGIFLLMVIMGFGFISFKGQNLLSWGANYAPLTKNGEWWRLFTSTFLHGGLMHLLVNMYGLFIMGIFLEPLLGRAKFLAAYLLTGILASVASICWHDASVGVGASGAIFGLYGIFLALLLTKIFPPVFDKSFLIGITVFFGISLLLGLTGAIIGIDNAAHIGGLLSGFVVGIILYPTLKRQNENE
jgi:membrane associated rhomboid family serine protease